MLSPDAFPWQAEKVCHDLGVMLLNWPSDKHPGKQLCAEHFVERSRRYLRAAWVCQLKQTLLGRLVNAGVPTKYSLATFKTCSPDTPRDVVDRLVLWAKNPRGTVLLTGPVGNGKTHLATCAFRQWMSRHDGGRWVAIPEMLRKLRTHMDTPEAGWSERIVDELAAIPMLLLDDLGSERLTDWTKGILCDLVSARYNTTKPTILTTNLSLSHIAKAFDDRTASRLAEGAVVLKLDGTDRRIAPLCATGD